MRWSAVTCTIQSQKYELFPLPPIIRAGYLNLLCASTWCSQPGEAAGIRCFWPISRGAASFFGSNKRRAVTGRYTLYIMSDIPSLWVIRLVKVCGYTLYIMSDIPSLSESFGLRKRVAIHYILWQTGQNAIMEQPFSFGKRVVLFG